jgi:hypothetical protein
MVREGVTVTRATFRSVIVKQSSMSSFSGVIRVGIMC